MMRAKADRLLSMLVNLGAVVGGIGIFLMMLHITCDVALRTAFGMGLPGTFVAVSQYYMLAASFAPLALAQKQRAHISVEILDGFILPHRVRFLDIAILLLISVVMSVLAVRAMTEAIEAWRLRTAHIDGNHLIPTWPGYFFLPFGTGIMALLAFARLLEALRNRRAR